MYGTGSDCKQVLTCILKSSPDVIVNCNVCSHSVKQIGGWRELVILIIFVYQLLHMKKKIDA